MACCRPDLAEVPNPEKPSRLIWPDEDFKIYDIYVHNTIGDGSCMMHSILNCMLVGYRLYPQKRKAIIKDKRAKVADALDQIDARTGKTYYESVGDGQIALLGKTISFYSKSNIQHIIRSDRWLGNEMASIISYMYNITIFILDTRAHNVHIIASAGEYQVSCVVLRYSGTHYETVSIRDPDTGKYITHFDNRHSFIDFLHAKILKSTS